MVSITEPALPKGRDAAASSTPQALNDAARAVTVPSGPGPTAVADTSSAASPHVGLGAASGLVARVIGCDMGMLSG